jgi:hypothetical protein
MSFQEYFHDIADHIERSLRLQESLSATLDGKPRRSLETSHHSSMSVQHQLFAIKLLMQQFSGMADGWFGGLSPASEAAKFMICEEHFRWRWTWPAAGPGGALSGLQNRVAMIETLRDTHPVLGSLLGSIVRIAGSIAKRASKADRGRAN